MSHRKAPEDRAKPYRMACVVREEARPHIEEAMKTLGCKNTNQLLKLGLRKLLLEAQEIRAKNAAQAAALLKGEGT